MSEQNKIDLKKELLKYDRSIDKMYWIFLVFILVYEILGSTPFLLYFAQWYAGFFDENSAELAVILYQGMMNIRFMIVIPAIYNIIVKTDSKRVKILLSVMLLLGWYYALRMRDQNDTYIFRDMAMVVASYGKDYKKIAKWSIGLAGGIMAFTVMMNLMGVIPEWPLERDGRIRHSFGTLGPTNLAGHVGFAIMAYMFIKNGIMKWYAYVVIAVLSVLNLILVDGRTSFLSVFLGICGCLLYSIVLKWGCRIPDIIIRFEKMLFLSSYPAAVFLYLVLVFTYSTDPQMFYNRFHILESLIGRIGNANRVMGVTGITPFGNYYENYWVEGNVFKNTGNYEFLDSSYARVLLMYGWVAFILILGIMIWSQYRLFKEKQTFRMYLLAVLSIHFIMEHHIMEPAYNIFLLLPFASFSGLRGGQMVISKKDSD